MILGKTYRVRNYMVELRVYVGGMLVSEINANARAAAKEMKHGLGNIPYDPQLSIQSNRAGLHFVAFADFRCANVELALQQAEQAREQLMINGWKEMLE